GVGAAGDFLTAGAECASKPGGWGNAPAVLRVAGAMPQAPVHDIGVGDASHSFFGQARRG
ncbi:MAG TPA: hypothetical protein VJ828_10115, partial [Lacipirellulaceae bacterium]|nr:hypothetical protein [Lacipirellulaceae bacterium]